MHNITPCRFIIPQKRFEGLIDAFHSKHLLAESKQYKHWESCEVRSKLTMKTLEQRHCRRSDVFIVTSGHISQLFLVFLFLTLNR